MLVLPLLVLAATQGSSAELETQKRTTASIQECEMSYLHDVNELVLEFNSTSDWSQLKRGLEIVLVDGSDVYMQLQNIKYDWAYPLHRVGRHDHSQLASLLLCAGLPVDTPDSDGHTMLHGAADGGHLQLVKLLLEHGADVDVQGSSGDTPLMDATEYGYLEVVKALMQAGADISLKDSHGRTALDLASLRGRTELVQYLEQFPR